MPSWNIVSLVNSSNSSDRLRNGGPDHMYENFIIVAQRDRAGFRSSVEIMSEETPAAMRRRLGLCVPF